MIPIQDTQTHRTFLNPETNSPYEREFLMHTLTSTSLILKLAAASLILLQSLAHASDDSHDHQKPDRQSVCFNLVCKYAAKPPQEGDSSADRSPSTCRAAAVFTKDIAIDGSELFDVSDGDSNPDFEVECDDHVLFNDRAHRYTDSMGTRIQALTGPYPAMLLPRGTLRDTRGYITSNLDLDGRVYSGYCYLYTGPQ